MGNEYCCCNDPKVVDQEEIESPKNNECKSIKEKKDEKEIINKKNEQTKSTDKKKNQFENTNKINNKNEKIRKKNNENINKTKDENKNIIKKYDENENIMKKNNEKENIIKKNNQNENIIKKNNQNEKINRTNDENGNIMKKNDENENITKKNDENENINKKKNEYKCISQKIYGFINQRNDCYLNSSLQMITHIIELNDCLKNYLKDNEKKENIDLVRAYVEILNKINEGEQEINPKDLKNVMGEKNEIYKNDNQEDANEFISNFLMELKNETKDKTQKSKNPEINDKYEQQAYEKLNKRFLSKNNSFLIDLLYGIFKEEKQCKNGHMISTKFNMFNMIELPIYDLIKDKNKTDLNNILNDFFDKKIIEEEYCEECQKKISIFKRISIYKLPKYLIIFFKRTVEHQYYNNEITYEEKIYFNEYLSQNKKNCEISDDNSFQNKQYQLFSVIEHIGSSDYGHYTAIILNDDNSWYRISDDRISNLYEKYESSNAIILGYFSMN